MSNAGIELCYLMAGVLFILRLKRMNSPVTARQGNALSALGMFVAIVAALMDHSILSFGWIWATPPRTSINFRRAISTRSKRGPHEKGRNLHGLRPISLTRGLKQRLNEDRI